MPVKESLMVMIITMIMVNEMVFCKTLLFFCISGNMKEMATIFTLPKGKEILVVGICGFVELLFAYRFRTDWNLNCLMTDFMY
jgi:hypothetical protein